MDGLALAELKRHARYRNPLSLGIVDIDHFKNINTNYDLTGGDEALKGLSKILTSTLREVDSVGRVGGEEFLVIARETDEPVPDSLAERIRSMVEETPIEFRGQTIRLTVSLGSAVAENNIAVDYPAMYAAAANALNAAKSLRSQSLRDPLHPAAAPRLPPPAPDRQEPPPVGVLPASIARAATAPRSFPADGAQPRATAPGLRSLAAIPPPIAATEVCRHHPRWPADR